MAARNPSFGSKAGRRDRPISVLLVDGDDVTAERIRTYFARNRVLVTVAPTLAAARALLDCGQLPIDVVILELRLTDGRGESLLADLEVRSRQPAVIVTSSSLSDLRADAWEYRPIAVTKPVASAVLLRMVRTVVGGYARPVIERFVTRCSLTKREAEAIVLVARGLRAKEIAERMRVREPTVYTHLTNICAKTDCSDYHEIVAKLFSFACQTIGHTPPDHTAFAEAMSRHRHSASAG
jgi:DNA-binding NarL/FixJ family response regulator